MSIIETIERSFFAGYATSDIGIETIFVCVVVTALIALYICGVYKLVNKKAFYDKSFLLSLFGLAIITSMVILTIQSNIVVSLGMVGALSIVRFRTAIKNSADLVFLFWSISTGIICGAGFDMIAVIGSIILTVGIVLFYVIPSDKETMLLVVNSEANIEDTILKTVGKHCNFKVRARNISVENVNIAIEVHTKKPDLLVKDIAELDNVYSVSLVEHDGEITA